MSKNRKFEKRLQEENPVVESVEETVEVQTEEVAETVETPVEEVVENQVEETIEEEIPLEVLGEVTAELLNVRSKPESGADVLTVIPVESIVTISDVNASPDFYKVLIGDLEGFCMKKFIKIKE